jgi:FAD/FMN-containing dehydrogenase
MLNTTSFDSAFVPEGAPDGTEPVAALTVGSGVKGAQMYEAADKAGVVVTGGASPTVGMAGGYVLGGGHGELRLWSHAQKHYIDAQP